MHAHPCVVLLPVAASQSALSVSSGALHEAVVEAVRPHMTALRGTPHGKRILQRIGAR